MSDCRKMYMVFAPRFENVEQDLQDGCFLTAGVGTSDTTWTVDDTSKLTGGRYFIGTPTLEERIQLLSVVSANADHRGARLRSLDARLVAGGRAPEEALARLRLHRRRRVGMHDLEHRGHRRRQPEGRRRVGSDRGSGRAMQVHGLLGGLRLRRHLPVAVVEQRARQAHRAHRARWTFARSSLRYSYPRQHDLYLGTFLNTDCGKVTVSVDGVATTP